MLIWIAVGLGVLWVAVYAVVCRLWPFAECRRCDGRGKFEAPRWTAFLFGRGWRRCRRCKGTGSRVRLGRRLWIWTAGVKKSAIG